MQPFVNMSEDLVNKDLCYYLSFGDSVKDMHIAAVFNIRVFSVSETWVKQDETKVPGSVWLQCSVLLDTGANISLVTSLNRLVSPKFDRAIKVFGLSGGKEASVCGISTEFGKPAVLVTELNFDIVSLAQLEVDHVIKYTRGMFVVSSPGHSRFYLFLEENGMFFAHRVYDSSVVSVDLAVQEVEKRKGVDRLNIPVSEIVGGVYSLQSDMDYAKQQATLYGFSAELLEKVEVIRQLHIVLGHPGEPAMRRLIEYLNERIVKNARFRRSNQRFQSEIPKKAVEAYYRIFKECTTCNAAKMKIEENHFRATELVQVPGNVHADLLFYSRSRKKCFLTVIDEKTKYAMVVHMDNKTANSAHLAMAVVKDYFVQHHHVLTDVHSDRDKALTNESFGPLQVSVHNNAPGAHNNLIERFNRTLGDIVSGLRLDIGYIMPNFMHALLVKWACQVFNMRLNKDMKSPYELFHGGRPFSLEHLTHHFGEIVMSRVNYKLPKHDAKGEVCIVVGMDVNSESAFLVYCLKTGTMSYRSKMNKVTVDRQTYVDMIEKLKHDEVFEISGLVDGLAKGVDPATQLQEDIAARKARKPDIHPDDVNWKGKKNKLWYIESILFKYDKVLEDGSVVKMYHVKWLGVQLVDHRDDMTEEQMLNANHTREVLDVVLSEKEYNRKFSILFCNVVSGVDESPFNGDEFLDEDYLTNSQMILETVLMTDNMTIDQGLKEDFEKATAGIKGECMQMVSFGVLTYFLKKQMTPEQIKATLPSFMFLKRKYGEENALEMIKARLVGGGHKQDVSLIDPETVSATTLKTASYNMLLNFATLYDVDVTIVDVKCAYLQVKLPDDLHIWVKLDKRVVAFLKEVDPTVVDFIDKNGEVYAKLNKALYGLVQSAKLWYDDLMATFKQIGYLPLPYSVDQNVLMKVFEDGRTPAYVGVHSDDMGIFANREETDIVTTHLEKRYGTLKIQRGDKLRWLGIQIVRDRKNRSMELSQHDYIERCIAKFSGMLNVPKFKQEDVPCKEDLFMCSDEFKSANMNIPLTSIVMSIMFLAGRTRPDLKAILAYFTTRLLHHDPEDMVSLVKLIGYIVKTKSKVLRLSPLNMDISVMADSAFGNYFDRKSQSAGLIGVGYNPLTKSVQGYVHAFSVKQKEVAQSTAEAELYAQAEALKHVLWLKHLLVAMNIGPKNPKIRFFQDNEAAIRMAQKGGGTFRNTKHIEHKYFFITDHLVKDNIELVHLATEDMVPDLLTKTTIRGARLRLLTSLLLNEEVVEMIMDEDNEGVQEDV